MNTYHIFYTRFGQLPTGVNIQADDEADALETFKHFHAYEKIIYMAQMELIHAMHEQA